MTFLYPFMLAGLAGLSVPFILHLIARHRFPIQDFPCVQFLRGEERHNVLAMRLVDPLQLLLRLMVVALLVLAMARVFDQPQDAGTAPHNLVVVLDCSASMRMLVPEDLEAADSSDADDTPKIEVFEQARAAARTMLERIETPSQCALVIAGKTSDVQASLQPSPEEALASLDAVEPSDGVGSGLVDALATACRLVENRREVVSRVVVLTDMRSSALAARSEQDLATITRVQERLGEQLELTFVDFSQEDTGNLAIERAEIRGGAPKVGDDAHVVATVSNRGSAARESEIALTLGSRRQPGGRQLSLEPGERAVVDLTVRMPRAVRSFVNASLEEDDFPVDDVFSVPLNVVDARRILVVRGDTFESSSDLDRIGSLTGGSAPQAFLDEEQIDGAQILRYVLNPGRELGLAYGTGINVTSITANAIAGQPLSKYELVILYDVSRLSEPVLADLDRYVRDGRAVLIVASPGTNAVSFNDTISAARRDRTAISPAELGNTRELLPPVSIDLTQLNHSLLEAFRDRLQGDLSIVGFSKLRAVRSLTDGATPIMQTDAGDPLVVERKIGRGRVAVLTFGFELEGSNFALTRAFPPFVWRLVDYLTQRLQARPPDIVPALTTSVLDVSEPEFAFTTELELSERTALPGADEESAEVETHTLAVSEDRKVVLPPLAAGQYVLRKTQKEGIASVAAYQRIVYCYPDLRESDMRSVSAGEVHEVIGPDVRVQTAKEASIIPPIGREWWHWIVAALMGAYFAEAIFGWILNQRREKQRELEGL